MNLKLKLKLNYVGVLCVVKVIVINIVHIASRFCKQMPDIGGCEVRSLTMSTEVERFVLWD